MYYDLQITVNIVYFQYYLYVQKKYVKFHNIKFKKPKSHLLIGLETSFQNWKKGPNVNIYSLSKSYIYCYLMHMVSTLVKVLTIMDGLFSNPPLICTVNLYT